MIARAMVPKVLSQRTRSQHPAEAQRIEEIMARQRPESIAAASRGMALRPDRTGLLRRIKVPALIVTGSEDNLMPLETSEAMNGAMAGSELVVIPGAAHLSCSESPVEFNRHASRFLAVFH